MGFQLFMSTRTMHSSAAIKDAGMVYNRLSPSANKDFAEYSSSSYPSIVRYSIG